MCDSHDGMIGAFLSCFPFGMILHLISVRGTRSWLASGQLMMLGFLLVDAPQ
jgi:hypothetical protein